MNKPTHFIECRFKACTYRHYRYAHIPSARCIGEGDWRAVADGKEYRTYGHLIPANVLTSVVAELGRQEQEHSSRDRDNA